MKNKITNVQGFRDFLPAEKKKRDLIQNTITKIFETSGFLALETPVLEKQELLLGKYGEDADKLIYKFEDNGGRAVGLRYDQTVPSARVISQYKNDLPKFFKRYQIQDVFRAEKTQRGRYRQFKQCDIDIYGSNSPIVDAEILAVVYNCLRAIGLDKVKIKINDRQILIKYLSQYANSVVDVMSIIRTVDKLDKITELDAKKELVMKGLSEDNVNSLLFDIINADISDELQNIIDYATYLGVPNGVIEYTSILARGLDYYTGMIFEVTSDYYEHGSLGGGGRYDNLINNLVGVDVPAVGFAFGFDRLIEACEITGIFNNMLNEPKIMVTVMDNLLKESLSVIKILRQNSIKSSIYSDYTDKLSKQLSYANKNNFDYVIILGEQEVEEGTVTVKNMVTGESEKVIVQQVVTYFRNLKY